jgi:parallel beta-helix repeat protein
MFFGQKQKNFGIIFVVVIIVLALPLNFLNLEWVQAQSIEIPSMIGYLEGEGKSFKLDKSEYLKITLDSSEPIKLYLESVPEMVILYFKPISNSSSATITLGGFLPSTTYHKYEDDYHNHFVFTTDEQGKYTYLQDLSRPHLVFIQPRPSTKFIKDDSNGGDCFLIGNWNSESKTCTLTKDVNETIQIDSDGITLDGNGHEINLNMTGYGVYLPYRKGVTIKNLTVTRSVSGIRLYFSHGNTIIKNTSISNDSFGISLISSNNNIVADNTISRNFYRGIGIYLLESNNNIIENNRSFLNSFFGAYLKESSQNIIRDNIFDFHYSAGVYLKISSNNNTLIFNTFSNNDYGVYLYTSNNNRIYNNNFINNKKRPVVYSGTGNIFDLPLPDGGNYWSDFDTPEKGCNDLNNDNICDSPYIFTGGQDNFPWTKKDGWLGPQNQKPQISDLGQFKSDGQTVISEGQITTESSSLDPRKGIVVFKATITDPDNDLVKLQVEVKEFAQSFDETNLLESDYLPAGSEVALTKNDFSNGKYKWRARVIDDKGGLSDWQEFGEIGNIDFEVKLAPLYTQVVSPYPSEAMTDSWDHLPYADGRRYSCGSKIYQCGCAITSIVMIARYYDITETQGADVNPKEINEWLKNEPGGYQNGSVNWIAAAKYTNWRIQYEKTDKTINNYALLDEYLNKNQPVIAKEAKGRGGLPHDHFIVIDNKLASTYNVKDPYWYNTRNLADNRIGSYIRNYENGFDGLRIYKRGNGLAQAGMVFTLGSPAELLIIDSRGRKVGKDENGIEYNEIPNAWYFEENYDDPTGEEPPATDKNKVLYILEPLENEYELEVIGTGDGSYSLYSSFYDNQGNPLAKEFHSQITSGQIVRYKIFFDPSDSSNNHIKIFDETPPEAEIYFDEANQELSIKGIDDITVDPEELCFKSKKETICQIQDEAGNITKLIFDKLKEEGKEIKAELKSVQYNNQPLIIFPKTELKYEWLIDKKSGEIKNLEQKINVKDQFDIQAKYNEKKDETKVKIKLQGEREQEKISPGVIIIKLITKSGVLDFKF